MGTEPSATPQRIVRRPASRGEAATGLAFLAAGSAVSSLLEIIYLNSYITLPGIGTIAFPITILIAFLFNMVVSRTAILWTKIIPLALLPFIAWLLVLLAVIFAPAYGGRLMVSQDIRPVLLCLAGIVGAMIPIRQLVAEKLDTPAP